MTLNLPDKEICEEYISGLSVYQIANKYNCSINTILRRLNKYNIDIRQGIDLPDKEICNLYYTGMSVYQLAVKYNCSQGTILQRLNKNNVNVRGHKNYLPDKEIINLYQDGMSLRQLADKYNCSRQPISRILYEFNIEIRQRLDLPNDEICRLYNNDMCACDISNIFNCDYGTIIQRLRENDIEIRIKSTDITKQRMSAAKQDIPYDEWKEFICEQKYCSDWDKKCKESNREKYDRQCFLCGLPEEENITSNGKQQHLSVHHYDMNKMQGCDKIKWKLVPLCVHCHGFSHTKLWSARIKWLIENLWN